MKSLFFCLPCRNEGLSFSAISAMSDEDFSIWLNTSLGVENNRFNIEVINYENSLHMNNLFNNEMHEKGLVDKRFAQYTQEEKDWYDNHPGKRSLSPPVKYYSNVKRLGYDPMQNHLSDYYTPQQLIEQGYVTVYACDDTTAQMILNHSTEISNCNIFTLHYENPLYTDTRWKMAV